MKVLPNTIAPGVPEKKVQNPGPQVTVLFEKRTLGTATIDPGNEEVSPAKYGPPTVPLASSTRPATTTPDPPAVTTIKASTAVLKAKSPAFGVAHVSVTSGVESNTSAVSPIMPRTAITSPGLTALLAVCN